jgi:limonene-1,2-epoxide hydrolase
MRFPVGILLAGALAVLASELSQDPADKISKALRKGTGSSEGVIPPGVELAVFCAIVTILILVSVALEMLQSYLLNETPEQIRIIVTVLYGTLTTVGTVGVLLFVAQSTGFLNTLGSSLFGAQHANALHERVDRVDKILLLLMIVFVLNSLFLVWSANRKLRRWKSLELRAKQPVSTLNQAVKAFSDKPGAARRVLRLFPADRSPTNGGVPVPTEAGVPLLDDDAEDTKFFGLEGLADGDDDAEAVAVTADFKSPWKALDAVKYLSIRQQFLFSLRRNKSPPVNASFAFDLYLINTLIRDMAHVVEVSPGAWIFTLFAIYCISPVMLIPDHILRLVLFVAAGFLPVIFLLILRSHLIRVRELLVDGSLPREVALRALGLSSPPEAFEASIASAPPSLRLHTSTAKPAASKGVTSEVAPGWPPVRGWNAPYLRVSSKESAVWFGWTGASSHSRMLWFGDSSHGWYAFFVTCASMLNAVYAASLVGGLSIVFVELLGFWGGVGGVLGLLLPSVIFVGILPDVLVDMSFVLSVEEMKRIPIVRDASRQQQERMGAAALKIIAALCNSKNLSAAANWTFAEREKRFAKAEAALGKDGLQDAKLMAKQIFSSFLQPGAKELSREDLQRLLTSLKIIDEDDSKEAVQVLVDQALMAMDLDMSKATGASESETTRLLRSGEVSISEKEFFVWYIVAGPGSPLDLEEDVSELADRVMRVLDKDGSGDVSLDELKDALGPLSTDLDVEAVLTSWDENGDRVLSRDELETVLRKSLAV